MPFSYDTSTNTTFAAQYQADLNLCGQCHNSRGAKWTDTSRYPHYSPQYNILIGNAGLPEDADAPQSAHRNNPKQCADCHTHRHEPDPVTPANPVFTGHDFQASPSACAVCHGDEETGEALKELIQRYVEKQMNTLQAQLDTWATTKADPALRPKYGKLAWEYNVPGHLSNPNEDSNLRGPTSQEQQLIPEVIKQARFSLYLVYQDKSKGIHNSQYVRHLLKTASDKVNALLQN
jgi:cytochrome c553